MANAFELKSLIEWLEGQSKTKRYDYQHPGECLLAQYLYARDVRVYSLGDCTLSAEGYSGFWLPDGFRQTARPTPHTFGAALSRARALATRPLSQPAGE